MADPTKIATEAGNPDPDTNTTAAPAPAPAPPPAPAPIAPDHTVPPAARTKAPDEIKRELGDAREKHADLMPLVEKDRERVNRQADRVRRLQNTWKVQHPDEPFDPHAFNPPALPAVPDAGLAREFHAAHYEVADLETELDRATRIKPA